MHKALLKDKKILLGVSGSIAIYKSLELIRLLIKAGAEVKVVMSEEAKRFITPLTFETLSQNKVLHVNTESWSEGLNHIHLGKWADLFVIAPATANTLNKLSYGIADTLLTQSALAYAKPLLLAPSANTHMMLHPATQQSLERLKAFGHTIIEPVSKLLACNDEGVGALAEVHDIFYACARALLKEPFWEGREVIITGGATREKIDDVRFISNFSSGKQAASLALAAFLKGAHVSLISSGETPPTKAIEHSAFENTHELICHLQMCLERITQKAEKTAYLFMASAVSDFIPKTTLEGKLKKENIGEMFHLELKRNTDILASLSKIGIKTIGFKAELDAKNAHAHAKAMLVKKGLDAVCLNIVATENPFGGENNACCFITADMERDLPLQSKLAMGFTLLECASHL